jgi:hypothetical protein
MHVAAGLQMDCETNGNLSNSKSPFQNQTKSGVNYFKVASGQTIIASLCNCLGRGRSGGLINVKNNLIVVSLI